MDPFRALLATIAAANNSDILVHAANFVGITILTAGLSERDVQSHGMRI